MKTKKRRVEYISFYNHTGLEDHFTKMAKEGWLIESISNFYWTYRKIEPKDLHFCVTYYHRASDFDPEPSEEQQTFHDFCAHTGWQLTCTWHQMQVFYNEKENPVPLETDPVMEVETLHKACKKNFLPSCFLLLALGLVMCGSFIARIFADPIELLSNANQLLSGFAYLCMVVITTVELTAYYFWYYKAKKTAQDGIFVDTPSTSKLQIVVFIVLVTGLFFWVINLTFSEDPVYKWVAVLVSASLIAIFLIVNAIKYGLKRASVSREINKVLTLAACFILPMIMTALAVSITLTATRSGVLEADSNKETIPLSLADLMEIDENEYLAENRLKQTVLLSERIVYQRPGFDVSDSSGMPDLGYTVTIVKMPFLYRWCKGQLFNTFTRGYNGTYVIEYLAADASPWGTEEAYRQLDEFGEVKNSYLICYTDRFVLIHFDWEPTPEQMAIVSQKLNP